MGSQSEYLIWREKDGFFYGLHNMGEIRVWSIGSGKFVYIQKIHSIYYKSDQYTIKNIH